MGTLIGKAYPVSTALQKIADHTYVECDTGKKGWGCWGGKTGGRAIISGTGSTAQADAIATTNERAGITCYAINGVCHQAANRILWPSKSLVSAASGYWLSSSLYTTYGKNNYNWFHICEAPFDQHMSVTGDLPACTNSLQVEDTKRSAENDFAVAAMSLHTKASGFAADDAAGHLKNHLEHVTLLSEYRLGSIYTEKLGQDLCDLHVNIETERLELNKKYAEKSITIKEFADEFNKLTIKFQDQMAQKLKPEHYRAYFCLEHTERLIILDPDVIDKIYAGS